MEALQVSVAQALMELDKQALAVQPMEVCKQAEQKALHPFLPSLFAE